jgi:hypothetical protein
MSCMNEQVLTTGKYERASNLFPKQAPARTPEKGEAVRPVGNVSRQVSGSQRKLWRVAKVVLGLENYGELIDAQRES